MQMHAFSHILRDFISHSFIFNLFFILRILEHIYNIYNIVTYLVFPRIRDDNCHLTMKTRRFHDA
jgi:hypothetical protein